MNRVKVLIGIFSVAAFLAACGGSNESKTEPTPVAAEQAVPAPAPQVQDNLTPEAPAVAAEPIPLEAPKAQQPAPSPKPAEQRPPKAQRPAVRTQPAPAPAPEPVEDDELEPWEPPQTQPTPPRTDNDPVIVPSPPRPGETDSPPSYPPPDDRRSAPVRTQPVSVTLREGTAIEVRLEENLNSSINQNGDRFQAILERDLEVDGQIVARRGDRVSGRLEGVDPGGRVKGLAEMTLLLDQIQAREKAIPIQTNAIIVQAEGSVSKDAKTVGVATGIGAVIGAIAGGKKGAAIGAAIGGGAGTARVLTSRGKDAVVEREQLLSFRLERDVVVAVR